MGTGRIGQTAECGDNTIIPPSSRRTANIAERPSNQVQCPVSIPAVSAKDSISPNCTWNRRQKLRAQRYSIREASRRGDEACRNNIGEDGEKGGQGRASCEECILPVFRFSVTENVPKKID